jgi:hypothetical protein
MCFFGYNQSISNQITTPILLSKYREKDFLYA